MSGRSFDSTIQLWDAQTEHTSPVNSVAFSPDGRHIVSGSNDRTIRLWEAQTVGTMEKPLQSAITKCLLPIHFSSSGATHALHNAQNLFLGSVSNVGDCRDLVYLQNDGWIVGPNKKLLLWIPFSYHSSFHYTPWVRLIIPRGTPELDLSRMAHGSAWYRCYLPTTP